MAPNYTTRSAIETGFECRYKRYLNYFYGGSGIVPVGEFVPLSTGLAIHEGIEDIQKGVRAEEVLGKIIPSYKNIVANSGFFRMDTIESQYIMSEQAALIEALTLAWNMVEKPKIDERFNIIAVEKEMQLPLDKNGDLILLARADAILEEKRGGQLVNYSIKSIRSWYDRMEDSYRVDLQGKTEALVASVTLKKAITATKFCFLVKGRRYKRLETRLEGGQMVEHEFYQTDSPLIYGYRTIKKGMCKFSYAHTNSIIKTQNKSGYGRLGKEWQKFRVWETERMVDGKKVGGIRKWLEILATGKIQPELGIDPIKQSVITPVEVHRTKKQIQDIFVQIQNEEKRIFQARDAVLNGANVLAHFPMNCRACYFPTECEYLRICPNGNAGIGGKMGTEYDPAVAEDPLGSGEYMKREPHYELERTAQTNV